MEKLLMLTGSNDPEYNLDFENRILNEYQSGEIVILWQNSPSVIIGKNQDPSIEIDLDFAREKSIPYYRRSTGGGAVYQDLGNINYSFITDGPLPGDEGFFGRASSDSNSFKPLKILLDYLRYLGLTPELSGRNDILINGKKISGTAEKQRGNRNLFHGTILFDVDLSIMDRILTPPPEKLKTKGVKSVASRVINIRPLLKRDMTTPEFLHEIKNAYEYEGYRFP